MEQYIPKSVLVAEIERKINEVNSDNIEDWHYRLLRERDIGAMKNILSLINSLEVKEVDLKDEVERFAKECGYNSAATIDFQFAKHFFELGLKVAQKGE